MNGNARLWLSLAMLGIFVAVMLAVQPYSADWPSTTYATPVRRYIQAAIRQDSLRLRQLSATPAPVRWALAAARSHRLEPWRRRVQVWTGERRGDTTEVFVYPSDRDDRAPIVFRFVGAGREARVVQATGTEVPWQ